jgi:clan AA aspartic protease (TIGR02281 family)
MKNGIITAKVKINGVEGKFIVDTGASLVSITPEFSRKSHLTPFSLDKITTITANGNGEAQLTTIDNIKLGSLSANKVSGVIMSQNLGDGADGLLGLSFLSRFHFSLNENKLSIGTTPIAAQAYTKNSETSPIPKEEKIIKSQATENTDSLLDIVRLNLKN